jgi:prohibitin 1
MRLLVIAHYSLYPVPIAIGVALLQSSLYDVPGGFRAVMFDRFSGVKDQV